MIYYTEDDENIRDLVLYALSASGYKAKGFADGKALFEALETEKPEVILLDIMLPGEDGISLLAKLKKNSEYSAIPVIMLSAKSSEMDKVNALDAGADDYMVKPFGIVELIARIKAVKRRLSDGETAIRRGNIEIDRLKHKLTVKGENVILTNREFELLFFLMAHPESVFTREQLLETVWGYEYAGDTRTVDVHVKTLRRKLGDEASVVETVFGVGYRLRGTDV
jgi:Response regulators consisting of a CheY-like receiver domain and a winged-helix DNA-binding domain